MATRSAEPGPNVALSSSHDSSRPTRSDPRDGRARMSDGAGCRRADRVGHGRRPRGARRCRGEVPAATAPGRRRARRDGRRARGSPTIRAGRPDAASLPARRPVPGRARARASARGGRGVVVPAQPSRAAERRTRLGPRDSRRAATGREPDRRAARRPPSRGATRPRRPGAPPGRGGGGRRRLRDAAGPRLLRPVGLRPDRSRSTGRSRSRRARTPASRTGRTTVVGIHGTNLPWLLGQAVSHGCVRVSNAVATRLRRLAPLGTPIDIVR